VEGGSVRTSESLQGAPREGRAEVRLRVRISPERAPDAPPLQIASHGPQVVMTVG